MRLQYIDRTRGFAMCSVVVGHVCALANNGGASAGVVAQVIRILSIYQLVIFFVISGYLFGLKKEKDFGSFVKKKIKGLMIPYGVFSILNILFFTFVEPVEHMTLPGMLSATLSLYGISVLWFFPALFLSELGWWFWHKKFGMKANGVTMLMLLLLVIIQRVLHPLDGTGLSDVFCKLYTVMGRAVLGQFFVGIGHWYWYLEERFQDKKQWKVIMGLVFIGGCLMSRLISPVDLRVLSVEPIGIWCTCAIMLSVGIMFLFRNISFLPFKVFEKIGKNTVIIMCTHLDFGIPIFAVMCAAWAVAISPRGKDYVYWGLIFLCLTVIEILIIYAWKGIKIIVAKMMRNK